MANIAITPGNVIAGANARTFNGTSGATITAGHVLYYDSATAKYKLAICDAATEAQRTPAGIALNNASAGQPVTVLVSGEVTIGGTIEAGVSYYLTDASGRIGTVDQLTTGDYPVLLGMGKSTSVLFVSILNPGVALA